MSHPTPRLTSNWAVRRAAGIALGVLADRIIPDPTRYHPVALFGTYAAKVEKVLYHDTRPAGVAYVAATITPPILLAVAAHKKAPTLSLAVSLWIALGARTLEHVGQNMAEELTHHNTEAARGWVPWLCSRDPQALTEADMARATVESLAENTSDATIAPIILGALAGAPGVIAHRAINTLDAMVGYKNTRYTNFGWAAARLDDVIAYLPARATAAYHLAYAALKGRSEQALTALKTQAPHHPSPNAGPVEATAAAALGVTLGGATTYAHGVEHRPELGFGPAPTTATIRQAIQLARFTEAAATLDSVITLLLIAALTHRAGAYR